mmetsp:Transcript_18143/g.31002  ORF Transcript_18143/g.31002 Transcript_18143/m.31002 type:complete len:122 (+) Transcript_18143:38-403(+)
MCKTFLLLLAASYLKDKVTKQIASTQLEEEGVQEHYSYLLDEDQEHDLAEFETDVSILAEYGLVVQAQDTLVYSTAPEDAENPCDANYYNDINLCNPEWKTCFCVRMSSTNGFVEEFYEEI